MCETRRELEGASYYFVFTKFDAAAAGAFVSLTQELNAALSCDRLFVAPWTIACQTALSREFSRQEYWSRLPFPTPGNFSDPGIEPRSLECPVLANSLPLATWETCCTDVLPNIIQKRIKNKLLNQNLSVEQQFSQNKTNLVPQNCMHIANFIPRVPASCTMKIKVSLSWKKSDEGTKILLFMFPQ